MLKRFFLTFAILWLVLLAVHIFKLSERMGVGEMLASVSVLSFAVTAGIFSTGTGGEGRKSFKSNMISCKRCGYLGAGAGTCPKCKWSYVEKLAERTTIVSCPDCGYLGAGAGHSCPRCHHTRAEKIEWGNI